MCLIVSFKAREMNENYGEDSGKLQKKLEIRDKNI